MPKADYLKDADMEFAQQLLTFKNNITPHVAQFGLTPAQVTAQGADADRFYWEVQAQEICRQCAEQWTAWKNITRAGGNYPASGAPVSVALPAPVPPAVAPGVEARFRALAGFIKKHPAYNPATGQVLGIEGQEISGPDLNTLQADLKATVTASGVMVRWGWQGYVQFLDAIEIQVDRLDGQGFKMLTIDTTPNYLDTQPFPAAPAKWTYKAVFRLNDQRVGQWSDPVSVNVG